MKEQRPTTQAPGSDTTELRARSLTPRFDRLLVARTRPTRALDGLATLIVSAIDDADVLAQVAQYISETVACGSVFELDDGHGAVTRTCHAPKREDVLAPGVLDALTRKVRAGKRIASSASPFLRPWAPSRDDLEVERVRVALGADWIQCVPVLAEQDVFGTLTIFGDRACHAPIDRTIATHLARLVALAARKSSAYRRAIDGVRQRDELLAMVSHDLKNQLAVIHMSTSVILERDGAGPRSADRAPLEAIARNAHRMEALIRDLLDLGRVEAGAVALALARVPPRALVLEAEVALAPIAEAAGIHLFVDVQRDLPPVLADGGRVQQVFGNLVGNAVKFTPPGGSIVLCALELATGELAFSITDNGRGVPEASQRRVFDRYWQTSDSDGSGLGLAICKALVELQHGRIWMESALGRGTSVTFTLPVAGTS